MEKRLTGYCYKSMLFSALVQLGADLESKASLHLLITFAGRDSCEGKWFCHYMKIYLFRVLHLGNFGLPGEFELTCSSSLLSYKLGFRR